MRYGRTAWTALAAASLAALPAVGFAAARPVTERERFDAEQALHNKQQALAQSDQALRKADLDLRREEQNRSRWTSPLVLAIVAAAIAALGSAVVAFVNGRQQRQLERERGLASRRLERDKAESDRILKVVETGGNTEAAAANLRFLLDTGLVTEAGLDKRLGAYLATRTPGTGPSLPAADGRFSFEASAQAAPETEKIASSLQDFCAYVERVGFAVPAHKVRIDFEDINNALYQRDRQRVVLGPAYRQDPDVAWRTYMNHLLVHGAKTRQFEDKHFCRIEAGLSSYYPCSFVDRPGIGENAARILGMGRRYVRSLDLAKGYPDQRSDEFENGEIWGSLFWAIRHAIGRDAADRLLLAAWTSTQWPNDPRRSVRTFLKALLASADSDSSGDLRRAVTTALRERGFPVPG